MDAGGAGLVNRGAQSAGAGCVEHAAAETRHWERGQARSDDNRRHGARYRRKQETPTSIGAGSERQINVIGLVL